MHAFEFQAGVFRRGAVRRVSFRATLAGWLCLSRMPRTTRCGPEEPYAPAGMPRLRAADVAHRRDGGTHRSKLPLTTWFWAAHVMATHSNGMSARQLEDQLGVTYKTAWLLAQKLRRSMVDPDRELLEGVVEVDQTEIPFRVGDAFFEPSAASKILVVGAVEVVDRSAGRPKPRRKGAKYLGTRSGVAQHIKLQHRFPLSQ